MPKRWVEPLTLPVPLRSWVEALFGAASQPEFRRLQSLSSHIFLRLWIAGTTFASTHAGGPSDQEFFRFFISNA